MQVTKVMRYQLIYADDEMLPFKDFMKEIYELQREMSKIKNRAIQLNWEFQNFSIGFFKKNGRYPTNDEINQRFGASNIRTLTYRILSKEFEKNNTANVSTCLQLVNKKYKDESKKYITGERSIPSFKSNGPIELHCNSVKLNQKNPNDKTEFECVLSLISNKRKKELNVLNGAFRFRIKNKNRGMDNILKNVTDGQWKKTSSKLTVKKGKLFLNLGYSFTESDELKDRFVEGRIMGIDMGICYPVYMSFNDNPAVEKILPGEIENFRRKVEYQRRCLQEHTKYCGSGKIGHGVKCRTKSQEKLSGKIANFRDRINHQYSNFVVDFACRNKCGVIQMENLSGISNENSFLRNWTYYDLQQKIEYKAKAKLIDVVKINPKFTSQRCSKCGYIDKENRESQSAFICKNCGFEANADYNASQNIATKGIDKIIEDYLKKSSANT